MPVDEAFSDDYIANLLVNDAKDLTIKYSAQGLQAFQPKRPAANAPKPNTRFLKNILLDTDNHNASLRAREISESRSRLKNLQQSLKRDSRDIEDFEIHHAHPKRKLSGQNRDEEVVKPRRPDQALFQPRSGRESARREHDTSAAHSEEGQTRRRRRRDSKEDSKIRRRRAERDEETDLDNRHRPRRRRRHQHQPLGRDTDHRHDGHSISPRRDKSHGEKEHRQHQGRHHSKAHLRSRSPDRIRSAGRKRLDDSVISKDEADREHGLCSKSHRSSSRGSISSDPLDTLIGPAAPIRSPIPNLQRKGRGAVRSANATIDTRFSSNYDPALDVHPNSESEDDWDQALEALRDRRKWKQQGADRLREAGFAEADILKWEKGGEKSVGDVTWAAKGEGREWDRGKTTEDDYGRLK